MSSLSFFLTYFTWRADFSFSVFFFLLFFISSASANKISRLAIEDFSVSQAHILKKSDCFRKYFNIPLHSAREVLAHSLARICADNLGGRVPLFCTPTNRRKALTWAWGLLCNEGGHAAKRQQAEFASEAASCSSSSAGWCNRPPVISLLVKRRAHGLLAQLPAVVTKMRPGQCDP